jgi:hypothetical protein
MDHRSEDMPCPSLDVVTDGVNRVLREQRRWPDAIDAKRGLAFAFAGVGAKN